MEWSKGSSNLRRKTRAGGDDVYQGILWEGIELLLEAAERRVDVSEEQRTFPQADRIGWERMRKGVCMGSEKGRR